jgi:uncharacterized protein (TIGR02300 family)
MAKAELGLKRSCLSCGMKFYDFGRTPIICPGCQAEFDPESLVRSRRGRATAKPAPKSAKAAPDAGVIENEAETEVDEIEDEAAAEGSDKAAGETDDDYEEADIDVSNDDSAGLISDDLDEDEDIMPGISSSDEN